MLRWWKTRKMRWAVRRVASMSELQRWGFRAPRRFNRNIDAYGFPAIIAPLPAADAQRAKQVEDAMLAMYASLKGDD